MKEWNVRNVLDLYNAVKHWFKFPSLCSHKCQWETISWKSYFNLVCKRKGVLYGEQGRDNVGNQNHQNSTETATLQVMRTTKQRQPDTHRVGTANNDNFDTAFRDVTMTDVMRQRHVSHQQKINAQIQSEMEQDANEEEKWEIQRLLDPGVSCSVQPVGFRYHVAGYTINNQKPHRCHGNGCSRLVHNLMLSEIWSER